ncbi:hypothetical protein LEL_02373 [Akanthomyces lecanii RCEF 1005]|uniref:Uncharacterized protein n=1 Tax=Akanthomyces lecanii RCEF 1005 TaxID=1081108 RepID=A0A168I7R6_CORDF|nr:hypothetical protein LEL_02373 [Akanthomyces lecanii RCEF 1005]
MCNAHLYLRSKARVRYGQMQACSIFPTDSDLYYIFDDYGRLDRRFCGRGTQRGSGVWGSELDYDEILLIKSLDIRSSVQATEKRLLMARMLTAVVLEFAREQQRKFFAIVASPEDDERAWEEDIYYRRPLPQDQEFCALGSRFWQLHRFRRIGLSPFLAFTDDINHPSRALIDDFRLPRKRVASALVQDWMSEVESLLSGRALDFEILLIGFTEDVPTPSWTWVDSEGMTILHHAARSAKVYAVDYFMRAFPPLIEMRDIFNRTPLDALLNEREVETIICTFEEDIRLPDWKYVTCIGLLSGTEIYQPLSLEDFDNPTDTMAIMKTMDAKYARIMTSTLQIVFGCTCGCCIFGAISPRMSYQLLYHARKAAATWSNIWSHVFGRTDPLSSILYATCLRRTKAQHEITQAEQKTVAAAVEVIVNWFIHSFTGELLVRDGTMRSTILSQVPATAPDAADYLQRDGLELLVVDLIFDRAVKTDEWVGNGQILEECGPELRALPECQNDSQYVHLLRRYLQYIRTIERIHWD